MSVHRVQVQTTLGALLREPKAREMPCGVFGSFGWSGEAVDQLESRLKVWHSTCFLMCSLHALLEQHTEYSTPHTASVAWREKQQRPSSMLSPEGTPICTFAVGDQGHQRC